MERSAKKITSKEWGFSNRVPPGRVSRPFYQFAVDQNPSAMLDIVQIRGLGMLRSSRLTASGSSVPDVLLQTASGGGALALRMGYDFGTPRLRACMTAGDWSKRWVQTLL